MKIARNYNEKKYIYKKYLEKCIKKIVYRLYQFFLISSSIFFFINLYFDNNYVFTLKIMKVKIFLILNCIR